MWTARILLEASSHAENAFVTLTYKDAPPELIPRDMQLFIKRLRKLHVSPLRYFGMGEYGEKLGRPHYHLAIFGLSILDAQMVQDAWSLDNEPLGFVHVGDLNQKSAQYIAGYTIKKLGGQTEGKHPEFARMSRGLGREAIGPMADAICEPGARKTLFNEGDVPCSVRINGKVWPLGPYLVRKLRSSVGFSSKSPPLKLLALQVARRSMTSSDIARKERKRARSTALCLASAKIDSTKRKL